MGQDVNSAGAGACLGAGSIKEFSVITSQCCCEPKNTLKNKKIKKNNNKMKFEKRLCFKK